jgi:hypothetical protein
MAYGITPDGRLFRTVRGGALQDSAYSAVWQTARPAMFTPGWHPRLDPAFAASGLTHRAHDIPIGNPAVGVTDHLSQTALNADISGWTERYT